MYFSGTWSTTFDKEVTHDEIFHTATDRTLTVRMMQRDVEFPYMETGEYQAIAHPYNRTGGRPLSMLVLLPKENKLAGFEAHLSADSITAIKRSLTMQIVLVSLPRFTLDTPYDLKAILPGMGMPAAFGGDADFSGMNGSKMLYISNASHKAFVEVNESGTEAAAATAVVMRLKGGDPHPSFHANHPFVFMILNEMSPAISCLWGGWLPHRRLRDVDANDRVILFKNSRKN